MKGRIVSTGLIFRPTIMLDGGTGSERVPTLTVEVPLSELPEGVALLGREVELRFDDPEACEHGVPGGDYCRPCADERQRARFEHGDMDEEERQDYMSRLKARDDMARSHGLRMAGWPWPSGGG